MVITRLRGARLALLLTMMLGSPFRAATAHPIHMSFTEARYSGAGLQLSIRVFANDFAAAVARRAGVRIGRDSVIDLSLGSRYIEQNLQVVDAGGDALGLSSCGATKVNDMLVFCLMARVPAAIDRVQVRNSVMTELFSDQVNVVQIVRGDSRATRLFVKCDGFKKL